MHGIVARMRYKSLLFDWDGTLAQSLEIWLVAFRDSFADYGLHLTDAQLGECFGDWHAAKRYGIKQEQELVEKIYKRAESGVSKAQLYEGAAKLLQRAKDEGVKLALTTATTTELINEALSNTHLNTIFDVVITGDMVKAQKPDPDAIYKALEKLGVAKNEAVMIGDSDKDLGAAKNAGIDSILFFPQSHALFYNLNTLKQQHPIFCAESYSQLLDWLEGVKRN